MSNMKEKVISQKLLLYLFLIIFLIISIFPFYWMFVGSTNDTSKMFTSPPTLTIGSKMAENFSNLDGSIGIWRVLFNSLFVSLTFVALALTVCTFAAYALAKFEFKGRNFIFMTFLLSMMIPYQATIIIKRS